MMRRLIALLLAWACVAPAYAQTITGGGSSGGSGVPANLTLTNPASPATFTLAGGKTATINNTLTLSGTDSTTMTFPSVTASIWGNGNGSGNTCGTNCSLTFSNSSTSSLKFNSIIIGVGAPPSSCTSPTGATGGACAVTSGAGTMVMKLTLSVTSGSFTGTTMTVTMPTAAANGYLCDGVDITNGEHLQTTAFTSTTVSTLTLYNPAGTATAPGTADVIYLKCMAI